MANQKLAKRSPRWQLFAAKNQLSRLVEMALDEPQTITVRGKDAVVVISAKDYNNLIKPPKNIIDCLCLHMLDDEDLVLFDRDQDKTERAADF